jgi:hypothetical protein
LKNPSTIHGLPVISPDEAGHHGFASITTDINAGSEAAILAGVCQHRSPERARLIRTAENTYQLALRREDISNIADE